MAEDQTNMAPSESSNDSGRITDLHGAIAQAAEKRKTWHALVKHGVALVLLSTLAFLVPGILLVMYVSAHSDRQIDTITHLLQLWLGAIITLVGTSTGFYFKTARDDTNAESATQ